MNKITQSTLVPISFMAVIFGIAFWMSDLRSATSRNVTDVDKLKIQSEKIDVKLNEVNERLARIEGKLSNINQSLEKKER